MSDSKTPWYLIHSISPARMGWYEVRWADSIPAETEMQFWTGLAFVYVRTWMLETGRIYMAFDRTAFGEADGDCWRGLCQPAAAPPARSA